MFGWIRGIIDRIAAGLYRRGQGLVEVADKAMEERRAAVRTVRDAVSEAMTRAEQDRLHG